MKEKKAVKAAQPGKSNDKKIGVSDKKKIRFEAKYSNQPITILCTNGKTLVTRSTAGHKDKMHTVEIYSDPFTHVAWNPNKTKTNISKNSSFAKRFGDLSSIC